MIDLATAGITPRHFRPGTQRLPCPECARAKHRPRDDALSLLIDETGATWLCHRCGFKGGVREHGALRVVQPALPARRPVPQSNREGIAAERARAIWRAARPAPADHPYLTRKRIPADGLRLIERFHYSVSRVLDHALLVPLRDVSGAIVNLQGIDADGEKRFLAGGRMRGCFACVGPWRREVEPELIAIGEGWASVSSYCRLHSAYRGVAAMSAGNLSAVARIFREKFPSAEIVVAADQDEAGARAAGEASVVARADIHFPGMAGVADWNDAEVLRANA